MRTRLLAAGAALLLVSACAQGPAQMAAQQNQLAAPAVPAANPVTGTVATATFLERAALSDILETQAGQLALARTRHPQIRAYAQAMVDHHQASSARLRALPEAAGRLPSGLDARATARMSRLQGLRGAEFDRQYVQDQVDAHRETLEAYEGYGRTGDVPAVKAFAEQGTPAIREHLRMAEALQAAPAEGRAARRR